MYCIHIHTCMCTCAFIMCECICNHINNQCIHDIWACIKVHVHACMCMYMYVCVNSCHQFACLSLLIYLLPFRTKQYTSTLFVLTFLRFWFTWNSVLWQIWVICLPQTIDFLQTFTTTLDCLLLECNQNEILEFFTRDSAMYTIPAQNTLFDRSIMTQSSGRL